MANKKVQPLTDTQPRNLKPQSKDYTLSDGNGLQLRVKPDGRKIWEIRYTLEGVSKQTTYGNYPIVSLKEARLKRDEIRSNAFKGIPHTQAKQEAKEAQQAKESAQSYCLFYAGDNKRSGARSKGNTGALVIDTQ